MSAYDHAWPPSAGARYMARLIASPIDMPLGQAVAQVGIEHGQEQAKEILRLLRLDLAGRETADRRRLLPALRRVAREAEIMEAALAVGIDRRGER